MAEKEVMLLGDKLIIPTDDHIISLLGQKCFLWQAIMKHAFNDYKNISGNWNYYNDGKQWLFKLVQKKKTIFWAAILQDTFRITFYFGDKVEPLMNNSDLPQTIKDGFKTTKRYGAVRAVSIKVIDLTDVDNVFKLIAIKHKLK